jgi:hypothetical protein
MVGGAGCVARLVGAPSPGYERSCPATVPYLGCAAVLQVRANQSMYTLKDDMFNVHCCYVRCALLGFKQCISDAVGMLVGSAVGELSGSFMCWVAMCQRQLDNGHVQLELVQLHMFGDLMTSYLLWGGIAAMVPASLVVISVVYGLRALKQARSARMEVALLEQSALADRHMSLWH